MKLTLQRKRRLWAIIAILIGISLASGLILYALRQNINLYYTPSQVVLTEVPQGQVFRIGGMVVKGSIEHADQGLETMFQLTDFKHTITVQYARVLPALFREGQGIVAQGRLNRVGVFVADQVLAKHDEKYMPPKLKFDEHDDLPLLHKPPATSSGSFK